MLVSDREHCAVHISVIPAQPGFSFLRVFGLNDAGDAVLFDRHPVVAWRLYEQFHKIGEQRHYARISPLAPHEFIDPDHGEGDGDPLDYILCPEGYVVPNDSRVDSPMVTGIPYEQWLKDAVEDWKRVEAERAKEAA